MKAIITWKKDFRGGFSLLGEDKHVAFYLRIYTKNHTIFWEQVERIILAGCRRAEIS
jgi:hypothetical protein